jgi:hypothetical protein
MKRPPEVAGSPVSICAVPPLVTKAPVPAAGTPALQLVPVNQLPVASIQFVWARAGVTTAPTANSTANARTRLIGTAIMSPPGVADRQCLHQAYVNLTSSRRSISFLSPAKNKLALWDFGHNGRRFDAPSTLLARADEVIR